MLSNGQAPFFGGILSINLTTPILYRFQKSGLALAT